MYYALYTSEFNSIKLSKILIMLLSLSVGVSYLTYTQYINQPKLFIRWTTTSMMVSFYICPLIVLLANLLKNAKSSAMIRTISTATYHIYLTQMTYYFIGLCRFITISIGTRILISCIVCIICGIIFMLIDNKLRSHIVSCT